MDKFESEKILYLLKEKSQRFANNYTRFFSRRKKSLITQFGIQHRDETDVFATADLIVDTVDIPLTVY